MPLLAPSPPVRPVHGGRRRLVIIGVAIVLACAAVASWSVVQPGGYGSFRPGCVAVNIPSSMGGALLQECGARARLMCERAFDRNDRLSLLIRPPCRTAGLH